MHDQQFGGSRVAEALGQGLLCLGKTGE